MYLLSIRGQKLGGSFIPKVLAMILLLYPKLSEPNDIAHTVNTLYSLSWPRGESAVGALSSAMVRVVSVFELL